MADVPPKLGWFHPTPGWLVLGLLAVEGLMMRALAYSPTAALISESRTMNAWKQIRAILLLPGMVTVAIPATILCTTWTAWPPSP